MICTNGRHACAAWTRCARRRPERPALTDTATFLANQARLSLQPLVKSGSSLINIYSVIGVNPATWPKVNAAGATAFEDFVTGTAGQGIIGTFGTATYGVTLFIADAGKDYASLK